MPKTPMKRPGAIGANVRRVREQRGWTLAELGGRLANLGYNLHLSAVANMETGARRITVEELLALAVALEVAPVALVIGQDDEPVEIAPNVNVDASVVEDWLSGLRPLPTTWNPHGDGKITVTGRDLTGAAADQLREWFEASQTARARRIEATTGAGHLVRVAHQYAAAAAQHRLVEGSGTAEEDQARAAARDHLHALNRELLRQADRLGVSDLTTAEDLSKEAWERARSKRD